MSETLKNGVIFLQHNRRWSHWYENLVTKLITVASGSPYIHTQVYLRGWVYEINLQGARKTQYPGGATQSVEYGDLVRKPIRDLTDSEVDNMVAWGEQQIASGIKYGVAKLLIQLCLFWTKPAWDFIYRKTGWEPFADNKKWGDHCSSWVDTMFKHAPIDLFPNDGEEDTPPGDFAVCDFFRTVNNG